MGVSSHVHISTITLFVQSHRDTVVQRIFRLGLIKCARSLRAKGIYDIAQYLWPRDNVSCIFLILIIYCILSLMTEGRFFDASSREIWKPSNG